ncbi:MAG: hypothetical protein IPJ65_25715 [Archangiaceae bacterium]|nr:hypothetical protein [Archangiaceae bacterium]
MLAPIVALALAAAAPEVALLSTPGEGEVSELRFQKAGAELSPAVASFAHVARSTVLGALVPGSRTVLAVAQTRERGDLTFAASLFRLEPGKPAVLLADRLTLASRPLVTRDGRAFVVRGQTGTAQLFVDEVDVRRGAARTVHAFDGDHAYLCGALDGELLVYRVHGGSADLVAVHRDALGVRTLVPRLAPMARDFALDGRTLYFTTADPEGWVVMRLDLETLALQQVARSAEVTALPTTLEGRLALSPGAGEGLRFTDGTLALLPRGPGFERVQQQSGGWALALHEVPSKFPFAYATELATGRVLTVPAPPRTRLDLAGVL